jgi:DNA integrity scanning protein DisA with diadenylate cyclase activity
MVAQTPPLRESTVPEPRVRPLRISEKFEAVFTSAVKLTETLEAEAVLLLLEGPADWQRLKALSGSARVLLAADDEDCVEGAAEVGMATIVLDMADRPVNAKLEQALLEALADDLLKPGAKVLAVYSSFEAGSYDSISYVGLGESLGRLTVRDLQQLETSVPLDTLQTVVNMAVEIGREGREGKPVGTILVVGDTRNVLKRTRSAGFDPVKGYSRKERNLRSSRVREGIKEIAILDGAIIISAEGVVEAAARYIDAPALDISLSKGLGSRHWAAAAISKASRAVAIAVSETSGTVRIFQNGKVMLRIESFRRPMKYRAETPEFDDEE